MNLAQKTAFRSSFLFLLRGFARSFHSSGRSASSLSKVCCLQTPDPSEKEEQQPFSYDVAGWIEEASSIDPDTDETNIVTRPKRDCSWTHRMRACRGSRNLPPPSPPQTFPRTIK
eukprot:5182036-Amphidinium_carterae.2